MSTGWIKIHRKLTSWEWYNDVNTTRVFLHLLLVANHKDNKWRGIEIKRGQRLTSISALATETNLSIKNIRTSIKRLKSTNEVASHSTAQHTVFTMVNYDLYQEGASEVANEGQAKGKQGATNKNDKNVNNDKKSNSSSLKNDGFEHWWKVYPKKVGKVTAEKSFKTKTKKMSDEDFMKFVDLISNDSGIRFKDTEKQFILSPATYLNQERYNDE
jgi:hypothetical protein